MFGALERGFRSMASLILVRNVVGELRPKRTLLPSCKKLEFKTVSVDGLGSGMGKW